MDIEIIIEGDVTSGHRDHKGIPGHRGGSLPRGATQQPVAPKPELMNDPAAAQAQKAQFSGFFNQLTPGEQVQFQSILDGLSDLGGQVLPRTRWYRMLRDDKGMRSGYVIGDGVLIISVIKMLAGAGQQPSLVLELDEPEQQGFDLEGSIKRQLDDATPEQLKMLGIKSAEDWTDWTLEGLIALLFVRREDGGSVEDSDSKS